MSAPGPESSAAVTIAGRAVFCLRTTVAQVLVLRVVDPPFSSFMVARQLEAWGSGDFSFRIAYDWRDRQDYGENITGDVHPGTPRLFLDRFATPDGRARFVPVSYRAIAEEPDDEYPVLLTTGRVVAQYQSGAQTRRVDELNAAAPGPFVELHPRLAARLGAAEGDPVAVVSRRGRAVAPARITTGIRPDTVFMPFHWPGEGRANTLTNPALDPTSRMPEFKACAVRVEAVKP